jgi:hypothetical protein
MRRKDLFLRHARRLRDKAMQARRLAFAVPDDIIHGRLLALAERLLARSNKALQWAEEAERRDSPPSAGPRSH